MINRRLLLKALGLPAMTGMLSNSIWAEGLKPAGSNIITKKIPASGESLAVIGMGSSRTFNHLENTEFHPQLLEVLKTFFKMGGQLIDSSPMYGSAEELLGKLLTQLPKQNDIFAASKVWTDGEKAGFDAIEESKRRMAVDQMDLMQIHNLRDWKTHIKTLRKLKDEGVIRYIGITSSFERQYQDFEDVMKQEPLDFIQINYNLTERGVEKSILPLAQEKGVAVIINRPFQRGRLFSYTKKHDVPEFAKEFDCHSWAQFFLKFIVSHPAVTCAIPATTKSKHMKDNMMAQHGRLPDQKEREQMLAYIQSL